MIRSGFKNTIAILLVIIITAAAVIIILRRDRAVIDKFHRERSMAERITVTREERRIAHQFADSTLPSVRKAGLITSIDSTEFETIIRVSGTHWKIRSRFFKESFLKGITLHTKVRRCILPTKIVDMNSGHVLAEIEPPDIIILNE